MTHEEFRAALDELGWTLQVASIRLGVAAGAPRVGEWARGDRDIPDYIASSMRAHLELARCRQGQT